jgi:hypothetical protein
MAAPRVLPLLENVQIAAPCPASWDEMTGNDRVRFCRQCEKSVYDLSAMRRDEAEALLSEKEGKICVRLYRRADGTVLTADCPVGVRRRRRRRLIAAAVGGGAIAAGAVTAAAQSSGRVVQGAVAVHAPSAMGSALVVEPAAPDPVPAATTPPPTHLLGRPAMSVVGPRQPARTGNTR